MSPRNGPRTSGRGLSADCAMASSTCATSTGCSTTRRSCATGHASGRLALLSPWPMRLAATRDGRGGRSKGYLRWLERSTPDDPALRAYIDAHSPDVVLITPLIALGSSQIDYLRAARSLGIPTALCVWSWDHLSSKALIRELPDRVFVWNDTQRREARKLHGVPSSQIVVTGAQCFDKWFDRQPSRDRATFCRQIGLPAERPILLYVCSAPFSGSQPEAPFVLDWVRRIRMHALEPAARYADPDPAAPGAARRVGGRRSHAVRGRGRVGQRSDQFRCARRLLRLALSQRGRCWTEHERLHRGRDPRPSGVHDPPARMAREPDGHGAFQIPVRGRRWTADERDGLRRTSGAARS